MATPESQTLPTEALTEDVPGKEAFLDPGMAETASIFSKITVFVHRETTAIHANYYGNEQELAPRRRRAILALGIAPLLLLGAKFGADLAGDYVGSRVADSALDRVEDRLGERSFYNRPLNILEDEAESRALTRLSQVFDENSKQFYKIEKLMDYDWNNDDYVGKPVAKNYVGESEPPNRQQQEKTEHQAAG